MNFVRHPLFMYQMLSINQNKLQQWSNFFLSNLFCVSFVNRRKIDKIPFFQWSFKKLFQKGKFVYKFDWISVLFDALSAYTLGSNWVIFHNSLIGCLWRCRYFRDILCCLQIFKESFFFHCCMKYNNNPVFRKAQTHSYNKDFLHVCLLLGVATRWKKVSVKISVCLRLKTNFEGKLSQHPNSRARRHIVVQNEYS